MSDIADEGKSKTDTYYSKLCVKFRMASFAWNIIGNKMAASCSKF